MAYVRFGEDSDVYVFESISGLICCGCLLNETSTSVQKDSEMVEHLYRHRKAGHLVPERAFERLRRNEMFERLRNENK